jgi:hypothetical protein
MIWFDEVAFSLGFVLMGIFLGCISIGVEEEIKNGLGKKEDWKLELDPQAATLSVLYGRMENFFHPPLQTNQTTTGKVYRGNEGSC